eukprot:CAMPEP_0170740936 /NCGR_PEP_ID=MMETSP0437-20130122/5951_1 /TAXON_ID=0 /ORGANISM="Sexangularia sp." /LENGTH=50 /DNA_ID=CAMNT_0011079473 /DNA_START=411 /DNA_END=563 /DNA_ORIENTATION=+
MTELVHKGTQQVKVWYWSTTLAKANDDHLTSIHVVAEHTAPYLFAIPHCS